MPQFEAEPRLVLEDAARCCFEPRRGKLAALHAAHDGAAHRIGKRWQQHHVGPGGQRAHRSLAAPPGAVDAAHLHGIGNHQALEVELITQQVGEHGLRQRSRELLVRGQRRHR